MVTAFGYVPHAPVKDAEDPGLNMSDNISPKELSAAAAAYKLDPLQCKSEIRFAEWISLTATLLSKRRTPFQSMPFNWMPEDPHIPIIPERTLGIPINDEELTMLKDTGRLNRCLKELKATDKLKEIELTTLTGDMVIKWCTGGTYSNWTDWKSGTTKPLSSTAFRNELTTDRLVLASRLPDVFVNIFYNGEIVDWNALIAHLRLICELKPAELSWQPWIDVLREVVSDKRMTLTVKLLKLQDAIRPWLSATTESWTYQNIFNEKRTFTGTETITPVLAHVLLSLCVLQEPNHALFEAEKFALRAGNGTIVDAKIWVTQRHEAIRYLVDRHKSTSLRTTVNAIEEIPDDELPDQVAQMSFDKKPKYRDNNRGQSRPARPSRTPFQPERKASYKKAQPNATRNNFSGNRFPSKSGQKPGFEKKRFPEKKSGNSRFPSKRFVRVCQCNAMGLSNEEHDDEEECPVEDKLVKMRAYAEELLTDEDNADENEVESEDDDDYVSIAH